MGRTIRAGAASGVDRAEAARVAIYSLCGF